MVTIQEVLLSVPVQPIYESHCLFCSFSSLSGLEMITHLQDCHQFIVDEPEAITDLPRYLRIYSKLLPSPVPSPHYISSTDDTDNLIRTTINKDKLQFMLSLQQSEREDQSFSSPCVFCGEVFQGNCSRVIQHMFKDHGFNIGRPEGLVNVALFLEVLKQKVDDLQCLYCELTFRNRETLKTHLKKKSHCKLSPNNHLYDQFYIVNYANPGISWKVLDRERDDFDVSSTAESTIGNDEERWSDWTEDMDEPTTCLYCDKVSGSLVDCLNHMIKDHNFDLVDNVSGLDFLTYVQLINYLRFNISILKCPNCSQEFSSNFDLVDHIVTSSHFLPNSNSVYCSGAYLVPLNNEDPFLHSLEVFDSDEEN
ncbi:hypothetical protein RCL1_003109 [Eukaryota sp. TZLM3-RCL]